MEQGKMDHYHGAIPTGMAGDDHHRVMIQDFKKRFTWSTGYNSISIPLAAGALYNSVIVLGPASGAILMSLSTIIVIIKAQLQEKQVHKKTI